MEKKIVKLIFAISLFISFHSYAADPSIHDVYEVAKSGNLNQAESMIEAVIENHPGSAKAHYVAAEIYAQKNKLDLAKSELKIASKLEPGLPFVKPAALKKFENSLGGKDSPATSTTSFPWGALALLLAGILLLVIMVRRLIARNAVQVIPNIQPSYSGGAYPAAPQASSGIGSGILGGLATGAALGAGMVAGEELAHHFLDDDKPSANSAGQSSALNTNDDMGGNDFGVNGGSSWDNDSGLADISGDDWT